MPRKKADISVPITGTPVIEEAKEDATTVAVIAKAIEAEEKARNFADYGDIVAKTDLLVTITNAKKYEAFQKNIESAMIVLTDYVFVGNGKILLRVEMR